MAIQANALGVANRAAQVGRYSRNVNAEALRHLLELGPTARTRGAQVERWRPPVVRAAIDPTAAEYAQPRLAQGPDQPVETVVQPDHDGGRSRLSFDEAYLATTAERVDLGQIPALVATGLELPVAILRQGRVVPHRIVDAAAHEPVEPEVEVAPLHRLTVRRPQRLRAARYPRSPGAGCYRAG